MGTKSRLHWLKRARGLQVSIMDNEEPRSRGHQRDIWHYEQRVFICKANQASAETYPGSEGGKHQNAQEGQQPLLGFRVYFVSGV